MLFGRGGGGGGLGAGGAGKGDDDEEEGQQASATTAAAGRRGCHCCRPPPTAFSPAAFTAAASEDGADETDDDLDAAASAAALWWLLPAFSTITADGTVGGIADRARSGLSSGLSRTDTLNPRDFVSADTALRGFERVWEGPLGEGAEMGAPESSSGSMNGGCGGGVNTGDDREPVFARPWGGEGWCARSSSPCPQPCLVFLHHSPVPPT